MAEYDDNTTRTEEQGQAVSQIYPDSDTQKESEDGKETAADEKYQRLAADFANYKKRVEAGWSKFEERIEDRLLTEMLSIYNDFVRLDTHIENNSQQQAFLDGVKTVQKKWQHWLRRFDIKTIDPQGKRFDHNVHDAISYIPIETPDLHDRVVQVVQKGYRRGERILRHAQVVVGRYTEPEQKARKEEEDKDEL